MRNAVAVLGGLALGAGLMYMLDPERGRRRRAVMRDRLVSGCNRAQRMTGSKARHLSNRAKGLMHETRSTLAAAAGVMAGTAGMTADAGLTADAGAENNTQQARAAGAR